MSDLIKKKMFKKKVSNSDPSSIGLINWLIFGVSATICFFVFSHSDIIGTAESSFAYLNGHILDFYSDHYESAGNYGANYLPSTFLLFAIWNLPIKILKLAPDVWGTSGFLFIWYKLLPVIIYFISGYLIYRICKYGFGFSKYKSLLGCYIFITTPMAFWGQFIFSQYDIFTVFFMLLGLQYYYKNKQNLYLFSFYLGMSMTFKYFSIFIFIILLLLCEKRIIHVLKYTFISIVPILSEFAFCYIFDKEAFRNSVLNFGALDFVKIAEINVGSFSIRILPLLILLLIGWSYFIKPDNDKELVKYSLFFSCGICFALFSFMTWSPHWIMFAVPFLILSILINKFYDIFLWLDILFIIILYIISVNWLPGNVDERMLTYGVFFPLLKYREIGTSLTMSKILPYIDLNLLYTILVAILGISFIFKHPKYCFDNINTEFEPQNLITKSFSLRIILRIRLLATVLGFLIPALICLPSMCRQSKVLWSRDDVQALATDIIAIDNKTKVIQPFHINSGKVNYISEVRLMTVQQENTDSDMIVKLDILEKNSKKCVGSSTIAGNNIGNYEKSIFKFSDIEIKEETDYIMVLEIDSKQNSSFGIICMETERNQYQMNAVQQNYIDYNMLVNGENLSNCYLWVDILGE